MFNTLFYQPIYNGLVFLMDILPWIDAGLAVILFTCIVKLALFPLSRKAAHMQLVMKKIQPEIDRMKKSTPDKQAQSLATLKIYKEHHINPFASFITILIQLPIIFALYKAFNTGFPTINGDVLYSFVRVPEYASSLLFGFFDITTKGSLVLALLVGITQFVQAHYALSATPKPDPTAEKSFQTDFARSMGVQMKYVFPIIVFFMSRSFSAALSLYWITSNLFAIGQELYMRARYPELRS